MIDRIIAICMQNKLVVILSMIMVLAWALVVAPFDFSIDFLPRDPVPVDAIPDLGENQQIVFTEWPGRSPQDIEDQVTYPLTTALLGIPGVHSIRSNSMFGFSSIYVIFEDDIEFYWSRSRILEKLNSLPKNTLPENVQPVLGPDATAMGQIFWYTLEGRTPDGQPAGGWDLHELRSIQDWLVRYALQSAKGVAEVASVGGFVREYQINVDPEQMRSYEVTLPDVIEAVRRSNQDVGARTFEHNGVEYLIRGRGFIENLSQIKQIAVDSHNGTPIQLEQIADIRLGPGLRRGVLDKAGAEAVGGVVVARHGANPMAVIQAVKEKIEQISPGLPQKTLSDGTVSQVAIVPFYDRTGLIQETLGTLSNALQNQIIITVIVVLLMVFHLRSALLISLMLPLSVLITFIFMKLWNIQANVVALGGIAIAIGTVVDMGIVMYENILQHLRNASNEESRFDVIRKATSEVGGAVLTAVLTTIVSFLPVFFMTGAEGKLFTPLAFTKTFALIASILISILLLPVLAHLFLGWKKPSWLARLNPWLLHFQRAAILLLAFWVMVQLAIIWEPLGAFEPLSSNLLFILVLVLGLIGFYWLFQKMYIPSLRWFIRYKLLFVSIPVLIIALGLSVWLGFQTAWGWLPAPILQSPAGQALSKAFPGLGREFMPTLDEGSFLYMPSTMPHAGIGVSTEYLQKLDMAIQAIPEVETVVGKIGRVESPLDPAPLSMIETVILYQPEFRQDANGNRLTFAYDQEEQRYLRDDQGNLIPDPDGLPYRNWRPEIKTPDDIWDRIVEVSQFPGLTSAPKLAPISTRLVMLQTGMRAPMGVKVKGTDLERIEEAALQIEEVLQSGEVEGVRTSSVVAERVIAKPYIEVHPDREAIARYGLHIQDVMDIIEVAIGGKPVTMTVEGRERYPIRIRYPRELRDTIDEIKTIFVPAPSFKENGNTQSIPLQEIADIRLVKGPQSIKSEDNFLVSYVLFDKQAGYGETDVVLHAQNALQNEVQPTLPESISYEFAGNYQNQLRAARTLSIVLPVSLFLIMMILYLQFRSLWITGLIFLNVVLAWAGGFLFLWLWNQPWFLDVSLLGLSIREFLNISEVNLSVAVWVGFLALFGIATDDAVIMATYIREQMRFNNPQNRAELQQTILQAASRRIRPCLMTSATTLLALLPVLASTGKGSQIMAPLAIPIFGGMLIVQISVFWVPVLYSAFSEWKFRRL